jgi:hypothetical protein
MRKSPSLTLCLIALLPVFLTPACGPAASVNVNVVGSRTALENQVLGSYQALDEDLALVASVRAIDPTGKIQEPPPVTREKEEALDAARTLQFYQGDLADLKAMKWVAEKRDGEIAVLPYDRGKTPKEYAEVQKRIKDEEVKDIAGKVNAARMVTWKRIIETSESLKEDDLPKVREIFGKLNYDSAKPGEMIEGADGKFEPKAEAQVAAK